MPPHNQPPQDRKVITGPWPRHDPTPRTAIDHINGNPHDNSLGNVRQVAIRTHRPIFIVMDLAKPGSDKTVYVNPKRGWRDAITFRGSVMGLCLAWGLVGAVAFDGPNPFHWGELAKLWLSGSLLAGLIYIVWQD